MEASMYEYFKPGLIHFMAYPKTMKGEGPIEETIRKIALDDYFSAIEITWIKDERIRQRVKKMLDESRLTVAYGGQPRLLTTGKNVNHLDPEKRKEAVDTLKEGIDEAYGMEAVGFGFLSGIYEEETKEDSFQALAESIDELCSYAAQKGSMKVALEVFDYDVDKKSLIGPVDMAKRIAQEIRKKHDNFGLMVDLSHLPLLHETARKSLIPVKDYIVHAHMGNAVVKEENLPAYGDAHPRFGFPESENDVEELVEYLRVLLEIGYLEKGNPKILSFEVKPYGDEDPDLVVANAKRTLNLAWSLL